jgi:hypothetical protein
MLSLLAFVVFTFTMLVACQSPTPERVRACLDQELLNRKSAYGVRLRALVARTRKRCIPSDGRDVTRVKEIFPFPLVTHPPTGKLVQFTYYPSYDSLVERGWVEAEFSGVSFDECCEIGGVAASVSDWTWDSYRGCVPFELMEDNGLLLYSSDSACRRREHGRPTSTLDAGTSGSESSPQD